MGAPEPRPPDEESAGVVGWIIFFLITVLSLLGAYIQITGIKQLPLPF